MAQGILIGWRAWYDRDLQYNSAEHAWNDLPVEGCQVRMLYFDGRCPSTGVHYRVWEDGCETWFADEAAGLFGCNDDTPEENQEMYPGLPAESFKHGLLIGPLEYRAIVAEAADAKDPP